MVNLEAINVISTLIVSSATLLLSIFVLYQQRKGPDIWFVAHKKRYFARRSVRTKIGRFRQRIYEQGPISVKNLGVGTEIGMSNAFDGYFINNGSMPGVLLGVPQVGIDFLTNGQAAKQLVYLPYLLEIEPKDGNLITSESTLFKVPLTIEPGQAVAIAIILKFGINLPNNDQTIKFFTENKILKVLLTYRVSTKRGNEFRRSEIQFKLHKD